MKTKWIVCCGMRRSGSTLQYLLAREVIGYESAIGWMIWQNFDKAVLEFDGKREYVLLKTHPYLPEFSDFARRLVDERRLIPVYVHRDLRDVVVSLLQFHAGMVNDAESIRSVVNDMVRVDGLWRSIRWAHVSRYDVMMISGAVEALRISQSIGKEIDRSRAERIGGMFTKKKVEKMQPLEGRPDPETMLHVNHIQNGQTGRWRNELKVEWVELIERIAGNWLIANGYKGA